MPYGGTIPLDVICTCVLDVHWRDITQKHRIHHFTDVQSSNKSLLGYSTCCSLQLVHVNQLSRADIARKYPDVFRGVGKLANKTDHIHIDTSVKPVAQRSARIPFHWRPTVEVELQKLLNFERWLHRTCWKSTDTMDIANSMRPKEKPRWKSCVCVCVCVLVEANETIVRERHLMHLMHLMNLLKA